MLTNKFLILFLALSCWHVPQAMGQDDYRGPTASQIRARKLADQWKGSRVVVLLTNGESTKGRLINASFDSIIVSSGGRDIELPLGEVAAVILPPGLPEIAMIAVMVGVGDVLGYGLISLTHPTAEDWVAAAAAGSGGLLLGYWGHSVFYKEIRYDLREE